MKITLKTIGISLVWSALVLASRANAQVIANDPLNYGLGTGPLANSQQPLRQLTGVLLRTAVLDLSMVGMVAVSLTIIIMADFTAPTRVFLQADP